jgi:hypothetical protein
VAERRSLARTAAIGLLYAALSLWWTWPLAAHLSDHVVDTVAMHGPFGWLAQADILLVVWALAWDLHALATAPLHFLDANIFHPAAASLARADHFVGNLPLSAPVQLLTGNPLLAHQAVLLLAFSLSALAMYVAVHAWTGSVAAGAIGGLLFGFAPWRTTQLGHLQLHATMYLPLVLLAAERAVRGGRAAAWLCLVVGVTMQALCSVYLAFVTVLAAVMMALGSIRGPRGLARAAGVVVVVAMIALVVALPYASLAGSGAVGATATGPSLALLGANSVGTYALHARPPSTDGYYFLGWTCIALALVGLVSGASVRRGLLLVLLAGWVVSLGYARQGPSGPVTLPLGWLAALVPGAGGFRAPVRLGLAVALAAPALAGLGFAAIERRLPETRVRLLLAALGLGLVLVDLWPARVPLRAVPVGAALPAADRWLRDAPAGPVLELPTGLVDDDFRADVWAARWQSGYQYASTLHWRPLLNGYSAHPPDNFFLVMALARRLPDEAALSDLVDLTGLRWLVVHRRLLTPEERARWEQPLPASLALRATLGDDLVFEVLLPPRRDLAGALRDARPRTTTLRGLARDPLPPAALRGMLRDVELGERVPPGLPLHGRVTVDNLSSVVWPGFDPDRRGLVGIAYRWRQGDVTLPGIVTTRLAHDLGPGEAIRVPFSVVAPDRPGRWELVLTLRQHDGPWFDEAAGIAVVRDVLVGADDGA